MLTLISVFTCLLPPLPHPTFSRFVVLELDLTYHMVSHQVTSHHIRLHPIHFPSHLIPSGCDGELRLWDVQSGCDMMLRYHAPLHSAATQHQRAFHTSTSSSPSSPVPHPRACTSHDGSLLFQPQGSTVQVCVCVCVFVCECVCERECV